MQVVILCGGQGTRAYPLTQKIPKALMEIDGQPIVEHVMRIYAAHGAHRFILSCGYLHEAIVEHFADGHLGLDIECVDTGAEADTGDRIWRLRDRLDSTFHATYCDGLGPIDIGALLAFHQAHPGQATLTSVPLRSQYGIVRTAASGQITGFEEKPLLTDYWINGGFFVFDHRVFDHWQGSNLERDVLPHLAERGLLHSFRHHDFWRSMDTYKDQQELNALWRPYAAHLVQRTTHTWQTAAALSSQQTGGRS